MINLPCHPITHTKSIKNIKNLRFLIGFWEVIGRGNQEIDCIPEVTIVHPSAKEPSKIT